ncbi:ESPR domain-containing protein, partial [Neisseriaceae bacterium TC5R-5]|nr:ESPR domain-containing protein [Neisseriaceae bacterium TC5R-5]
MNKIYRLIWDAATNRWAVTSELSKRRGKSRAVSAGGALLVGAGIALGGIQFAVARDISGTYSQTGVAPALQFDPSDTDNTLTATGPVTITNTGTGGGINTDDGIHIHGSIATTVNLLQGGSITTNGTANSGRAIYGHNNAPLTVNLKDMVISSQNGGGIQSDSILTVKDNNSSITVQNGAGNAISAGLDGSSVNLTSSTLSTNTGSAINLRGTGKTSTVTLADTTITTKGGDGITSAGNLNVTGDNKTSITVAGAGNGMTAATGGSDINLDGSSITTANG